MTSKTIDRVAGNSRGGKKSRLGDTALFPPSFITVKHGDNQLDLFNPCCRSNALIAHMREKCQCYDADSLALLDLEGKLQNLSQHGSDYADKYVDCGKTYILLEVNCLGGSHNQYISLLNDLEKTYPQLQEVLKKLSAPPEKRVRRGSRWTTVKSLARVNTQHALVVSKRKD